MYETDVTAIAREVVTIFGCGPGSVWAKATNHASHEARSIASLFAGYLPARVLAAAREHADEHPESAPKPSELRARIRAKNSHASHKLADPDNCPHPPPYAFTGEDDDGSRQGDCMRCYTTIAFGAGRLLTETEIEDRNRTRAEERML